MPEVESQIDNENARKIESLPTAKDIAGLFEEIWGDPTRVQKVFSFPFDTDRTVTVHNPLGKVVTVLVTDNHSRSKFPLSSWRAQHCVEFDANTGEIRSLENITGASDNEHDQFIERYTPKNGDVVGIKSSDLLLDLGVKPKIVLGEDESKFLDLVSSIYTRISDHFNRASE